MGLPRALFRGGGRGDAADSRRPRPAEAGSAAGGHLQRVELEPAEFHDISTTADLLAIDEALHKLSEKDPRKTQLVELRFFAGLTMPEAARTLGISLATAERDWAYAKAWLYREMRGNAPADS